MGVISVTIKSDLHLEGRPCSISGTHCVTLFTNLVISHEWGKDREVLTTSGTFVTQIFHNGQPSHGGDRIPFAVTTYRCFCFCTFSFWPLCCLFFFDIRILITSLWYHQTLVITENVKDVFLNIFESESVYRRRTDNTMAKKRKYKSRNNDL
jgi:hypothetical protein